MNCLNCGTENSDEAVFCRQCGARMDGKIICPNCSAENVADSNFCIICGQNLSQPTTTVPTPENVIPVAENKRVETTIGWKSTVSTLSGIFAMLGLLLSVIFTFFIGIKVSGSTGILDSIPGAKFPNQIDIFYYFGDAYNALKSIEIAMPDFTETSLYFPVIFATIVFSALLLAIFILSVLTLKRFVSYVTHNSQKDYIGLAIATYLVYIFGVFMFFVFNNTACSVDVNNKIYTVSCKVNDLTSTGIALSTIFIIASIICRITVNAKERIKYGIYNTVLTPISLIFVCVVLYLTIMPHIAYNTEYKAYVGMNFLPAISYLGSAYFNKSFETSGGMTAMLPSYSSLAVPSDVVGLLIISAILQILLIVLLLIILGGYLSNFASNKRHSCVSLNIVSTISTVLFFIFTIISSVSFWLYELDKEYKFDNLRLNYLIAMLILSVVQLTISLIHRSFNNIEKKAMQEQQLQY